MKERRRFRAMLVHGDKALGWTIARVPFDPHAAWPKMVRLRVCGEIKGPKGSVAFRTSLFPEAEGGTGRFFLLVNRGMQQGAGIALGSEGDFWLEPDLRERPAELPEEMDALLDEAEGLRAWYRELTEYTRREIGKWIGSAKGVDGRMRRAEQMAERMLSTMEAEVELPPLLEQAFRTRPRARMGWSRMTPSQRRGEMFAVFYYRTVEGREKRVAKLLDDAEKRGGKA